MDDIMTVLAGLENPAAELKEALRGFGEVQSVYRRMRFPHTPLPQAAVTCQVTGIRVGLQTAVTRWWWEVWASRNSVDRVLALAETARAATEAYRRALPRYLETATRRHRLVADLTQAIRETEHLGLRLSYREGQLQITPMVLPSGPVLRVRNLRTFQTSWPAPPQFVRRFGERLAGQVLDDLRRAQR